MWLMLLLLLFFVLLVGLFVRLSASGNRSLEHSTQGKGYTMREGRLVQTDAAFDAWTSADLDRMLQAVNTPTNKVDRHFLLQNIVAQCYKRRRDPEMRSKCQQIADLHISEFPSIAPALKRDMGNILPRVSTFQHLATLLTEDGEYERAIEVCELAQAFGLDDGTKGGFEGRIERIRKKQAG